MKIKNSLILIVQFVFAINFAQNTVAYKAEKEKKHNLIHTKLKVDFNFDKKQVNGEAWVTVKPHFYSTNTLILDAKAMLFQEVSLNGNILNYNYDDYQLNIKLPKNYTKEESFTIYIKYTARPDKVKNKLTNTLATEKGLYFINPSGKDKTKPTQIWTQGETEGSSCWFPTIDAPNQKTTQEIYITVPNKYKTLSNGKLITAVINKENRTDYWKLDQKHAPYLAFLGVGDFEVIEDTPYKNIPINYYVEKEFAPFAKSIFGNTPEMMHFFSEKLGVTFPWNKYSQIVVRDYVSGAMENTTAVVHSEIAYQKPGQLIDKNVHENTIAHELFHHWFGNLVTSESWANLTLNESFANYSEYLWQEYKYGKEAAEMHLFENNNAYLSGQESDKNLVRFDYLEHQDMFDLVSYNKGGAILHMLRNYVGDEAFFASLKTYLNTYKYKAAEAHELRLIFEKVTGKDLNWFFNQWYFGANHPELTISYDYNLLRKTVTINILQNQAQPFQFPIALDFFEGGKKYRKTVFVENKDASFTFNYKVQPTLIQVNADGVLLCKINENKVLSDYIFQLKNADHFMHRREALLEVVKKQEDKLAFNAVVNAMDDDAYQIQVLALENVDLINKFAKKDAIQKIMKLASTTENTMVQAAAIQTLGKLTDPELKNYFVKGLESESYAVLGKSLVAMFYIDKPLAIKKSKELPDEIRKILATPLTKIFIASNDETELPFIAKSVVSGMFLSGNGPNKKLYEKAFQQVSKSNNMKAIQNLTEDMVAKGIQYKKFNFDKVVINLMRKMVQAQEISDNTNKDRNVALIKTAMERLL
ncbi:M1 family metallopeptidase [uncultured Polaribacter sp.]|uniref:M1 family metallopeptidase n=1 Tax=uncultured Polaribacter sp. TaxID=174711 RepID=UPI00260FFECC|nr:M1 family metallopeptidase [uncultured Polaribacter sp.]